MGLEKTGDCFEANGQWIVDTFVLNTTGRYRDVYLCHGYVRGAKGSPVEGTIFLHCWIEMGDSFLDLSNGKALATRKDELYASGRVFTKTVIKYTPEEVADMMVKHGHYGSWDKTLQKDVISEEELLELIRTKARNPR